MAPGLVPIAAEDNETEEMELDPKEPMEDQNFQSFVQSHLTAQKTKRDKMAQQDRSNS